MDVCIYRLCAIVPTRIDNEAIIGVNVPGLMSVNNDSIFIRSRREY